MHTYTTKSSMSTHSPWSRWAEGHFTRLKDWTHEITVTLGAERKQDPVRKGENMSFYKLVFRNYKSRVGLLAFGVFRRTAAHSAGERDRRMFPLCSCILQHSRHHTLHHCWLTDTSSRMLMCTGDTSSLLNTPYLHTRIHKWPPKHTHAIDRQIGRQRDVGMNNEPQSETCALKLMVTWCLLQMYA